MQMIHRSARSALAAAALVLAAGCGDPPTDPSRPPSEYLVTYLGAPAGAESFTPRDISGGRIVGTARGAEGTRAVQWAGGAFSPIGPAVPANCASEALGASLGVSVGQVTCAGAAGAPEDAYGWVSGAGAPPRLFTEPYGFVDVNRTGAIVGTLYPPAAFPQATPRAFVVQGGAATLLLPEGATASEAVGISDSGRVAVTAYYVCTTPDSDCALSRAMVWRAGTWTDVPLTRNATRSVASAVSSEGHVAGLMLGEADGAFLYNAETDDLDALPVVPGTDVQITGANGAGSGQVVGTGFRRAAAVGQEPSYGIAWGDGRQYALTDRMDGEPWVITAALATDDEERVAGIGFNRETGQQGAVLLSPAP